MTDIKYEQLFAPGICPQELHSDKPLKSSIPRVTIAEQNDNSGQESKPQVTQIDGGGERKNAGKLPIELVPPSAIFALASVLQAGALKYAPRNWERGMQWSICYACAMRHLLKWFAGQDKDEETGLSHLYHAMCNIAFLIEYEATFKEGDDRPSIKERKNE